MATATRTVTVTVGNDPTAIGDAATHEELSQWAARICEDIESRFGVSTILVQGATNHSIDSDDPEIHAWLRDRESDFDWMQYL